MTYHRAVSGPSGKVRNEDPATYALVYAEAERALKQQQDVLAEARGRAAVLLSATAIATSFLGGIALDRRTVGPFGVAAIVLFVLVGLACLAVLLPIPGWRFRFTARKLLTIYVEGSPPASLADTHRDLALHADDDVKSNNARIGLLWWAVRAAMLLLILEVTAWLIELAQ